MRPKRRMNRSGNVPEHATCSVNLGLQGLTSGQAYTGYSSTLANYPRAITIAEGYQLYRIKRITYKFSPLFDTFTNASSSTVPYLYWMIDRTQQMAGVLKNGAQFRQLGAKPIRFDDKTITISFRPNVLTGTLDSQPPPGQNVNQFVQYKISPWLATRDQQTTLTGWNPDSTDHLGIVWLVENNGGENLPYKLEKIVEFEFKKPGFTLLNVSGVPDQIEEETLYETVAPPPA